MSEWLFKLLEMFHQIITSTDVYVKKSLYGEPRYNSEIYGENR